MCTCGFDEGTRGRCFLIRELIYTMKEAGIVNTRSDIRIRQQVLKVAV
jgi:hypothetical protein